MTRRLRVVALAVLATFAVASPGSGQALLYSLFERYLDSLRQQTGIPGLSAVIVKDGHVGWERGFGQQDIEQNLPAAADTPYPVGGLTQTVSAVLLGACAERGRLDIDAPIAEWAPDFPVPAATVRHVLAHASDGAPVGDFRYDEARFAALTNVAQSCSGEPFRLAMAQDVLDRLGMAESVPGEDLATAGNPARELFEKPQLDRYAAVLERLAVPYRVDRGGRATRNDQPARTLTAAGGLVSTARDLARFDSALDDAVLLRRATLQVAWSPTNFTGTPLPTGLGWFVQDYQGEKLIWHFSLIPDAYSALILKMPARRLTLIMLANSDGLSTGANLEQGDVTSSPFVKIFLRLFA
jgi:CubicO group peptidase (beta-lactamase class C family)